MESPHEGDRLLMKGDEETSREQLLLTGLQKGMTAVDAGGGVGFVTKIMSRIVGTRGKAILVDQSKERLQEAKTYCRECKNIQFIQSPLEKIKLDRDTADYTFCRFVFEYLQEPEVVFRELIRVTKPGGKIVVGDLDHNCLSHYPLAPHLETQLLEIAHKLQQKKVWDAYSGRKLFSYFNEAGLQNIKVHLIPHHLIYGESQQKDVENWRLKMERIEALVKEGDLRLSFDMDSFQNEFFSFFQNPSRFSYSPLILVEAVKAP